MKRSKPFSDVSRLMVVVLLFWLYQPGLRAEEADGASVEGATSEEKIAPSDDSSPQVAAATPDDPYVALPEANAVHHADDYRAFDSGKGGMSL